MPNDIDAKYFMQRATESRVAAGNAVTAGAGNIHTTLAAAYDDLADQSVDPSAPQQVGSEVEAVNGDVRMKSPGDVIVSFTPDAARATSDSLLRGATQAANQMAAVSADDVAPTVTQDSLNLHRKAADVSAVPNARAIRGHVVQTPDANEKYKVVLEYEGGADTEQAVSTIQEGEALIKRRTPSPPERGSEIGQSLFNS